MSVISSGFYDEDAARLARVEPAPEIANRLGAQK